ncbi:hypothetical protein [Bosea sp. PAMC 26642]|uniref:hypothetical protein n=1 Tax=Bosea sp. (strain PAMC 26642) TaxID=1792307 RepID=UPI0007702A9F|nr:hypothetical protein [Bosea sp. PAMC 26642]AMJ61504.1 hypothetical protein AXW83_15410 [Bosea sp. PAMC 26642]
MSQHVIAIGDVAAHSVGSRSGHSDTVEVVKSIDARALGADACIIQDDAAKAPFAGVESVVFAAI